MEQDFLKDFMPSGNRRLDDVLRFTAEIDKMTSVLRRTLLLDRSRRENDAEHSWHVAVMALLFEEFALERPCVAHAVEMLVVHDLVEVYAGDTFAYDLNGYRNKAEREKEASERLFGMLPEEQGARIKTLWEEFDACATIDAKYANCLDRLQPFFHNTLTEGHTWMNSDPRPRKWQVERRMAILGDFMPEVHRWVVARIEDAVSRGWLLE